MPETRIIHVRDWDSRNPRAVYIGRAVSRIPIRHSPWANPFSVKNYGREGAIESFETWARTSTDPAAVWIWGHVEELLDAEYLVCWCKDETHPDRACHGDVLLEMAREARERRLSR